MTLGTETPERRVFTIGHSNHDLQTFLGLLRLHGIEVLVDTRSYPYSKYASQFDLETLKQEIGSADARYLYLGKELGGRPKDDQFYDREGHVLYGTVAQSASFLEGIGRLESGIASFRVAIMCSEEDPSACHRRLLISRVLTSRGIKVLHIRGDGSIQSEAELAAREEAENPQSSQTDLFADWKEDPWRSTQSVLRKGKQPISLEP